MSFRLPFLLLLLSLALSPLPAAGASAEWATLAQPPLEVRFHPGNEGFAREAMSRAQALMADISARLGLAARGPYVVWVVRDRDELAALMPRGEAPPSWAAALAFPREGEVFLLTPLALKSEGVDYWQVLHHEMTHLVMGEAAAARETQFPRWLDEGVATWMAGEMSLPRLLHLTWAQITGSDIPFDRLTDGFPAESGRAEVAYAQSFLMVQYLTKRFGPGAVSRLVGEFLRERDLGQAVQRAFGSSWEEIGADYRDYSRMKATWIPVATSTGMVWGATALLFLFTYGRKRARARTVRERWAQEEAEERSWILFRAIARLIDGKRKPRVTGRHLAR
jgi:hypothetical protein